MKKSLGQFYCISISYKKADEIMRGKFSLNQSAKDAIHREAAAKGIKLFAISTCNRTEVFGLVDNKDVLIDLLCIHTDGSKSEFQSNATVFEGKEAIDHMMRLGVGLESQILGDFEIIGQIKAAFNFAKVYQTTNSFLETLVNTVIRTSKQVKNETEFSTNAASTAYAAVSWIKNSFSLDENLKITLFGTGEIGKITCANLVKHFTNNGITLINRTKEKAEQLSEKFEVNIAPYEELQQVINNSDVLIVATNATMPTVTKAMLDQSKKIAVVDLSIPRNVEVEQSSHVDLISLDDLTKVVDETLENRKAEIPKVEKIVEAGYSEFLKWCADRSHQKAIKAFKSKLIQIQQEELDYHNKKIADLNTDHAQLVSDRIIQKMTKQFVTHLKNANGKAEESVKLMNEIFDLKIKP